MSPIHYVLATIVLWRPGGKPSARFGPWTQFRRRARSLLHRVGPVDASLVDANLVDASLVDASLVNASLVNASLVNANLVNARRTRSHTATRCEIVIPHPL
jgi:hypothetical protein